MLIEFILSIEVDDDDISSETTRKQAKAFDEMLADMEEVIGKSEFGLDDSKWEVR